MQISAVFRVHQQDLVIFKAIAARPKDIEDAAALMLMHKEIDVDRVRRHVTELAELADEPSLTSSLEAVIKLSGRPSTEKIQSERTARSSRTSNAKRPSPKVRARTKLKDAPKPRRTKRRIS